MDWQEYGKTVYILRGRVLHNGEIQRKDGRYQFKYIDANGKEKFVYSWRLDHNDATLQGKVSKP